VRSVPCFCFSGGGGGEGTHTHTQHTHTKIGALTVPPCHPTLFLRPGDTPHPFLRSGRTAYDWMAAYSPIDNIVPQAPYPTILATAGLHDPRVGYWEPAKYAAKVRAVGAPRGPVMLKVDLGAGHFSKSGRFDVLKEKAFEHAFLLKAVGMLGAKKGRP
jgi:hypothetical protein